jgi:hypothetical protein
MAMLIGNFVSINFVITTAEIPFHYFRFILTITRYVCQEEDYNDTSRQT